jgi:hypothetical protein
MHYFSNLFDKILYKINFKNISDLFEKVLYKVNLKNSASRWLLF